MQNIRWHASLFLVSDRSKTHNHADLSILISQRSHDLLLNGGISNADVRDDGCSGLHYIPYIGSWNKDLDTDILLSYLLTCDLPSRSFEFSAAL